MKILITILALLVLVGCGGPSEADIQATVGAAVQATTQAGQIATSVQATQTASACEQPTLNVYADAVEEQITTFEQQATLTGSTPRVSMGVPMQKLLDIQTETRRMDVPNCMQEYHERVVSMMGLYRIAYETFAGQGDESLSQASLMLGGESLGRVKAELATIRKGEVPPTSTPAPATPTP
jgi:hypothetical protein